MASRYYFVKLEVNHLPHAQGDPILAIEALVEPAEGGSATTAFDIAEQVVRRRYSFAGAGYSISSKRIEPVASVHGIEGQEPVAAIDDGKVWRLSEVRE